jgi:hypothetical protein
MVLRSIVTAALVAGAASASAQTLKPGLWEMSTRMQGAPGSDMAQAQAEMQKQMAAMPPEQRKMMEEMMAKQGVRMVPGGSGAMNVQVCMTKEMVERNEVVMDRSDCKVTRHQRTGSTVKAAFACTNPPATGETQVTIASGDAYTSRTTVRTTVDGKPQTVTMDGSGKWLSANCGNLKPPMQR